MTGVIERKKQTVRHVRTAEGEQRYGQPIGSVIVLDEYGNVVDVTGPQATRPGQDGPVQPDTGRLEAPDEAVAGHLRAGLPEGWEFGQEHSLDRDLTTEQRDAAHKAAVAAKREVVADITARLKDVPDEVLLDTADRQVHERLSRGDAMMLRKPQTWSNGEVRPGLWDYREVAAERFEEAGGVDDLPEGIEVVSAGQYRDDARAEAVSNMVALWAATSNGTNARALTMQAIAEETFGLSNVMPWDAPLSKDNEAEMVTVRRDLGERYREFLLAQYAATQERFREQGITDVRLYRGVQAYHSRKPAWAVPGLDRSGIPLRPLSSFSSDRRVAAKFAEEGADYSNFDGYLMESIVPVERILSTPRTGVGALVEAEFVVLAGDGSWDVSRTSKADTLPPAAEHEAADLLDLTPPDPDPVDLPGPPKSAARMTDADGREVYVDVDTSLPLDEPTQATVYAADGTVLGRLEATSADPSVNAFRAVDPDGQPVGEVGEVVDVLAAMQTAPEGAGGPPEGSKPTRDSNGGTVHLVDRAKPSRFAVGTTEVYAEDGSPLGLLRQVGANWAVVDDADAIDEGTALPLARALSRLQGLDDSEPEPKPAAAPTPRKGPKPTQAETGVLSSVNPSESGVFQDYESGLAFRATAPLADNMTTLADTAGIDPDTPITLYRGVPPGTQDTIVPGDFVTDDRGLAATYGERVLTIEARYGDVLDDRDDPLGQEYLYRPPPPAAAAEDDSPLTITYGRNRQPVGAQGDGGSRFGQDIEPAGRYMIDTEGGTLDPAQWETGEVTFERPLRIPWGEGSYADDDSWKRVLSARYDGLTGEALSRAVLADGYDAIVTYNKYGNSEIVDLTVIGSRAESDDDLLATAVPEVAFDEPVVVEDEGIADYRMGHQPPAPDTAASIDDMANDESGFPDVYEHPEWYDHGGNAYDKDSARIMRAVRGKPDAMVTLYRAAPPGVSHFDEGNWVAVSEAYARQHAYQEADGDEDWPVYAITVPARLVHHGGNDIVEYGYWGPRVPAMVVAPGQKPPPADLSSMGD